MKGGSNSNLSQESQIINDVFEFASMNEKLPNLIYAFSSDYYTFYKQSGVEPTAYTIYLHINLIETRGEGYNETKIGYIKLSEPQTLIPEDAMSGIRLEYMTKTELKNSFKMNKEFSMSGITYINVGTNKAIA